MKVYVKKGDYENPIPGLIVTIVFLAVSIGIFYAFFTTGDLIEALENIGVGIIFALVFFCFGVMFLFYIIKPPKKFPVKLISKKNEIYKGKNIVVMKLGLIRDDVSIYREYNCYTYQDNDLVVGKFYNIFVKEFNWKIRKIGNEIEYSDAKKIKEKEENTEEKFDSGLVGFNMVLAAVIMIFSAPMFFSIIGFILYPQYRLVYAGVLIFFGIAFYLFYWIFKK